MKQSVFETARGGIAYWTSTPVRSELPWLVLLPGITADHRIFDLQVDALAESANLITWDAPSHGLSRPFPLDWSFDQLAEWLHAILEREGATRAVLAGHSMGGYVAQVYAERHPAEVCGFVGIDTAPLERSYYRSIELFFLRHIHRMYRFMDWNGLVRRSVEKNALATDARRRAAEALAGYDKDSYTALMAQGFKAHVEEVARGRSYRLTCPALLLCGEHDTTGAVRQTTTTWSRREGIPLQWIPGAAHNVTWDNPEAVTKAIGDFLEGNTALPLKEAGKALGLQP